MGLLLAGLDREGGSVSANSVGLLAAAFYIAELSGAPWFGAQSDRRGRRPFMVAGPIFGALAVQLIGWPRTIAAMAVGRVFEGFSTASTAPSTLSYLAGTTSSGAALRARVMAWYEMATVVGIAGGFVAGGILWQFVGDASFIAVTAIYGMSLAAFWFVRDLPPIGAHRREGPSILEVLRYPRVLRFVPAWLAINTILGAWFIHSAFLLTGEERTGQHLAGTFGGAGLSLAFTGIGAAFLIGIYLWGMAMGARRRTTIMLVTLPGIFIISATLWAINHAMAAEDGGTSVLVLLLALGLMVASGFTPAALAYLADLSEEAAHLRGAIMGLYSVMLGLGQLIGGAVGGPFAEIGGIDGLVLFTAILGAIATAVVLILRRYEGPELSGSD